MKLPSVEVNWLADETKIIVNDETYPLEGWRGVVVGFLALPAIVVLILSMAIVWAAMAAAVLVYALSLPAVFAARWLYRDRARS